jgi:LPS-assembly protein
VLETLTASYRGDPGWSTRGIVAAAVDLRWPFIGTLFGGTQRLTPRVQLVASPPARNLSIPNEDARAVELEDSNLFALNRFPGYDRWEDGSRVTYGLEWAFDRPRLSIRTTIGQSYRLTGGPSILPEGTGLSSRFSDIVGRATIRYGKFVELTHRFRIDKDSLAIRRNEVDAVVGTRRTYVTVGYLRLNRDIDTAIEDLRDREEVRLGARIAFARYWSVFGSTVIDLTDRREDPTSLADGYEPVRHRLGFLYEDDCIEMGLTWRRDYDATGDARRGNTYLLQFALKNLGR